VERINLRVYTYATDPPKLIKYNTLTVPNVGDEIIINTGDTTSRFKVQIREQMIDYPLEGKDAQPGEWYITVFGQWNSI
jgi:hypothetical protein